MSVSKKIVFLVALSSIILTSCLNGIDPMPGNIKDLSMSWSLPVGKSDFRIGSAYFTGPPNINLTLNVPEFAKHSNLYFADTVPVDLSKIYSKQYPISYLAFKINIWNDYTAVGDAKMYFVDAAYSKIDSLSLDIAQGHILFNGDIINPGYTHGLISFSKDQIQKLSTAESMIFSVSIDIHNTNTNDFKYYHLYKLTCQVGAQVDFILNDL